MLRGETAKAGGAALSIIRPSALFWGPDRAVSGDLRTLGFFRDGTAETSDRWVDVILGVHEASWEHANQRDTRGVFLVLFDMRPVSNREGGVRFFLASVMRGK